MLLGTAGILRNHQRRKFEIRNKLNNGRVNNFD
jgi:hypothetical protein